MKSTDSQLTKQGIVLSTEINNVIQKWTNSIFHPTIPTNLIAKSAITEVNDERAKLLTARFLFGERKGNLKDIPYDDREITNNISDLKVETLWLYGGNDLSEAPTGFSEKSLKDFQIPTGKTRKCNNCKGSGQVKCSRCNGTGLYRENVGSKLKSCSCENGKRCCRICDGYGKVHTVILVETQYKVEKTRKHDYKGQLPEKKLRKSSGMVIFEESADYPKDEMTGVLQGGINPHQYQQLQENVSKMFHQLIDERLQDYDGDIRIVHSLLDEFLEKMPNACEKNRLLEHEILPVRIGFKIEDAPVKYISYNYKSRPYNLWVYGNERIVYAQKRPFGITLRLAVELVILVFVVLLVFRA